MSTRVLAGMMLCGVLVACPETPPPPHAAAAVDAGAAAAPKKTLTVLVTGHETGALPTAGGRLLQQWRTQDHWPEVIALSTGDTFSGTSLSSHFLGEPTAEAMKALQYRAAALGNHELDLGLDVFKQFRTKSGLTFLGANVHDKKGAEHPLELPPFVVFERNGVKLGVVGFTSEKTIKTTVAGRAAGLELVSFEESFPPAVEGARKGGAEVVVVLIDDCFTALAKTFSAHPDWKVDLVVGGRCDESQEDTINGVHFFSVGDNLSKYVSATFDVVGGKVSVASAARKDLPENGKEDSDMQALAARWKAQLDSELGTRIGFTKKGFPADAPALRTWVATALRDSAKADAALLNKKGVRAELPKGAVTKASVYSMIPFENAVVTVKVPGDALLKLKAHPEAVLLLPAKVDPKKTYVLATTEYIYFGGDGLSLEAIDPEPQPTGGMWQTAVIDWTVGKKCDEKNPLEKLIK